MNCFKIIFWVFVFMGMYHVDAQVSTDCVSAIPICNNTPINGGSVGYGIDDFNGLQDSGCLERTTSGFIESNSAWYRFKTGASGQLGFNIGFDDAEDWDFALYKSNDCGNLGEPVRCNFYDNTEQSSFIGVGENPTGGSAIQYDEWLQVAPGEEYFLLVNNFSNSNSGFSIQFTGHIFVTNPYDALDCSIISNLLGAPRSVCEGNQIDLNAETSGAIGYEWYVDKGLGFQLILGETNPVLQTIDSGLYRVVVDMGAENMVSDVQLNFTPIPNSSPVTNEVFCNPSMPFNLAEKDFEVLGTQNASAFVVSYHDTLDEAILGNNALPNELVLASTSKQIFVRVSSLENPDCFDASQQFTIHSVSPPLVDFPLNVKACDGSTIMIGDSSPDSNYNYLWDSGQTSSMIEVVESGIYTLTISDNSWAVSCDTTVEIAVAVSKYPALKRIEIEDFSTDNTVEIVMKTDGDYAYQLDGGIFQNNPLFKNVAVGVHQVTINDLNGCGMVTEEIVVMGFPKHFSPNGDAVNEYWQVVGLETLQSPELLIFDRFGKLLAQINENDATWDGTYQNQPLPETDYWFRLSYTNDLGNRVEARFIQNHFALRR